MPKVPIQFSNGSYIDTNPKLGLREVYNCYPETTVGSVNKTVLRCAEGFYQRLNDVTRAASDAIFVDGVLYYVAGDHLYSSGSPYTVSTDRGALSAGYTNGKCKMVSNGKNIVILLLESGATTADDYYYDISTTTLQSIQAKDATYSSFGKAKDVTLKDGYYVFVTALTVFHGDNVGTGDGITFNALSFDTLPAQSGTGEGIEEAGGQLYVFARKRTFLYQTSSTTPFSFTRSQGLDMEIGLVGALLKTTADDQIFLIGNTKGSQPGAYVISGTSYQYAGNDFIDNALDTNVTGSSMMVSTYKKRGHRFFHIAQIGVKSLYGAAYVFDLTETQIQGAPIWHQRAINDGTGFSDNYIQKYLDSNDAQFNQVLIAFGGRAPGLRATVYIEDEAQSYGNGYVFDNTLFNQNGFQYVWPYLRSDGDPVKIQALRLRFADYVTTVELFVSESGGAFVSLGEFDLTTYDTKTAEWRRLGRFEDDVTFKVLFSTEYTIGFNPEDGNQACSIIEGYYLV